MGDNGDKQASDDLSLQQFGGPDYELSGEVLGQHGAKDPTPEDKSSRESLGQSGPKDQTPEDELLGELTCLPCDPRGGSTSAAAIEFQTADDASVSGQSIGSGARSLIGRAAWSVGEKFADMIAPTCTCHPPGIGLVIHALQRNSRY